MIFDREVFQCLMPANYKQMEKTENQCTTIKVEGVHFKLRWSAEKLSFTKGLVGLLCCCGLKLSLRRLFTKHSSTRLFSACFIAPLYSAQLSYNPKDDAPWSYFTYISVIKIRSLLSFFIFILRCFTLQIFFSGLKLELVFLLSPPPCSPIFVISKGPQTGSLAWLR